MRLVISSNIVPGTQPGWVRTMKSSILDKISKELDSGIYTEPKTLYLLSEIRKYIDHCGEIEKNKYPNLYFFCNWALHIQMDKAPAKRILKRFEKIVEKHKKLEKISQTFREKEIDFYMFYSLKEEFIKFLKENSLPYENFENNIDWPTFRKLLVEILKECPLVNPQGKVNSFAFEGGVDRQTRFRVKISGKGGGSFKITLKEKYYRVS